jgi:hypothetical protein
MNVASARPARISQKMQVNEVTTPLKTVSTTSDSWDDDVHSGGERKAATVFYDGLEFLDRLTRALSSGGVS